MRKCRTIGYLPLPLALLTALILALLPASGWGQPAVGTTASEIRQRLLLSGAGQALAGSDLDWRMLRNFFQRRGYQPAWSTGEGLTDEANLLLETLREADLQGLDPGDYHLSRLTSHRASWSPASLADLDLLLTDAFFRYCRDVYSGRADPGSTDPLWHLRNGRLNHLELLEQALAGQSLAGILERLAPQHPWYASLKQTLQTYRLIAAQGGWSRLTADRTLRPGMQNPAVGILRERLRLSGDLVGGMIGDETFDERLEAAVRRFQARHGLAADGVVGPKTRAALNVPVEERIGQIIVNLERWRWMPRNLEHRYILVNAAGFEMHVFEQNRSVLDMKIIVGQILRQTPTFGQKMTYLDINPFWNVPKSIAVKDILPEVRKNSNFLARQHFRVLSGWGPSAKEYDPYRIDWRTISEDNFPFVLRQDPGPWNALGRIKFMLPNPFNVYLHDTPHRRLFDKPVRTFSSGCIRLEHPYALADYLLQGHPQWSIAELQAAIDNGRREKIYLTEPIQVYLSYWTAWVDKEGTIQFRDDVYGRDRRLQQALTKRGRLSG